MGLIKKMTLAAACAVMMAMAVPAMASAVILWDARHPGTPLPNGSSIIAENEGNVVMTSENDWGTISCDLNNTTGGVVTSNGKPSGGTVTVESMSASASSCTAGEFNSEFQQFSIDKLTTSTWGTGTIHVTVTIKTNSLVPSCTYSGEGPFTYGNPKVYTNKIAFANVEILPVPALCGGIEGLEAATVGGTFLLKVTEGRDAKLSW